MQSHSSTPESSPSSSIWSFINALLAALFAGFALYWGGALFLGGIKQSQNVRGPKTDAPPPVAGSVAPAAAPTPAPAPAAPAPAATPAPAAASSGPVQEVLLKPDPVSPFGYDQKTFTVKSGATIKLTFDNTAPLPQPHNWVLGKPGTKDKLIADSMTFATNPQAAAKGYIMDDPNIIAHTKLLNPTEKQTIEFVAGPPGEYPYLCTFPGHAALMNGVMKVE